MLVVDHRNQPGDYLRGLLAHNFTFGGDVLPIDANLCMPISKSIPDPLKAYLTMNLSLCRMFDAAHEELDLVLGGGFRFEL